MYATKEGEVDSITSEEDKSYVRIHSIPFFVDLKTTPQNVAHQDIQSYDSSIFLRKGEVEVKGKLSAKNLKTIILLSVVL